MLLRRLHLQNDVALTPQLFRVGDDDRAGRLIVVVGKRRAGAGLAFDQDVETEFFQPADRLGRGGDAALART
jgi:hypothetical protein